MKTFTKCAVEMLGAQLLVFSVGVVVVLICHALFGLSAKEAADNVFALQMLTAGWIVRGWYEKFGASDEVSETR